MLEVKRRENGDLERVGRIGRGRDFTHPFIDIPGDFTDFAFFKRCLEDDRIFLVVDFNFDRSRFLPRQDFPQ